MSQPSPQREWPTTLSSGVRPFRHNHDPSLPVELTRIYLRPHARRDVVTTAVLVAVDLVILTLRHSTLHVLLVERGVQPFQGAHALPGGFLNNADEDILTAAHRELREEADLDAAQLHLEQLGAYGTPDRDPRGRVISVAYLAIAPGLPNPTAGTDAAQAAWRPADAVLSGSLHLAFDHRHIVADGVEIARRKLEHSALATAFCEPTFTISELQQVYEAVWGMRTRPTELLSQDPRGPRLRGTRGKRSPNHEGPTGALVPCRATNRPAPSPDPPHCLNNERGNVVTDNVVVLLTAFNVEYTADEGCSPICGYTGTSAAPGSRSVPFPERGANSPWGSPGKATIPQQSSPNARFKSSRPSP